MECEKCFMNGIQTTMLEKDSHFYCPRCGHCQLKMKPFGGKTIGQVIRGEVF